MQTGSLKKNVQVHYIETGKFKDVILSFRFYNELKAPQAWYRTLLAMMMADRCEKLPTKTEVSRCLDEYYGASVDAKTTAYGKGQVVEFRVKALNEKYVKNSLLEHQFELANWFLCNPLQQGGLFDKKIYEEAMVNMKSMIQRRNDNPSGFASSQCARLLGQGQPLGVSSLPTLDELNQVTLEAVSDAYHAMIKNDRIDIFVEGQVNQQQAECYLRRFFPFEDRDTTIDCCYQVQCEMLQVKEETRSIDQSALVIMYPTYITQQESNYWTLRVANSLFGQLPTSLLFQEVREKRSLCYSVYSSILSYDGVLMVTTGIDRCKVDEVKELIELQRQRVAQGDFDDEMCSTAKEMLINSILASQDDPSALINLGYQNVLLDRDESIESMQEKIQQVTREQIMQVFEKIAPKAIFVLKQKEDVHEENCE